MPEDKPEIYTPETFKSISGQQNNSGMDLKKAKTTMQDIKDILLITKDILGEDIVNKIFKISENKKEASILQSKTEKAYAQGMEQGKQQVPIIEVQSQTIPQISPIKEPKLIIDYEKIETDLINFVANIPKEQTIETLKEQIKYIQESGMLKTYAENLIKKYVRAE